MNLFRDLNELPERFRHGALSIGNFDGVHVGHARIVERLLAMARRMEGPAVVFTFDPHPAMLLRPDRVPPGLGWTGRKAELLLEMGVDAVIAYPTDRELLELEARRFFDRIVREKLQTRAMVEGTNFFFGHNRSGNVEVLGQFCDEAGMTLDVVHPVDVGAEPVSSSRIRTLIGRGDVAGARAMLGRPHRIRGTVVRGAGRGRKLGFPTANAGEVEILLPAEGIYAGQVPVEGQSWPAAISIGPNPTFGEGALKIEAYLIGYEGDLYGRPIEIDFLARLRNIEKFGSVDDLVAQMHRDVDATRKIVETHYSSPYSRQENNR